LFCGASGVGVPNATPTPGVPNPLGQWRLGAVCRIRDRDGLLMSAAVRMGERN